MKVLCCLISFILFNGIHFLQIRKLLQSVFRLFLRLIEFQLQLSVQIPQIVLILQLVFHRINELRLTFSFLVFLSDLQLSSL